MLSSLHTLHFPSSVRKHFGFVVEQKKFMFIKSYALAVIVPGISIKLNPTICRISLNLLGYTLRNITYQNFITMYMQIQHRLLINTPLYQKT
jgi:hypothetical protein